jgi:hypothetical protein
MTPNLQGPLSAAGGFVCFATFAAGFFAGGLIARAACGACAGGT